MSFSDFKEVSINDPGTAAFYGADDLLEVMKIFNAKIVSNRQIKIKNPWVWQDSFDILAAQTIPGNPAANTKRIYVNPSDNHLMVKSSAGGIIDIDVLGAAPTGESNTTSNAGTGGVGIVLAKVSADLPFKSIAAGSSKITVTDDTGNKNVDIDVVEANLTHNNISGILGVSKGGTGLNTVTTNALMKGAGAGAFGLITAGTDGNILTMVSGAPAWAAAGASADTKTAVFEAGTQVGSVGRRLNFSIAEDFDITENAGADRFDIAYRRSEVLVGTWFAVNGLAKTNIGTSYTDLIASQGDGSGTDVDGVGKTTFRLYVGWNKNAGSGTHAIQVISQTTSDVLCSITNLVNGRNVATGSIPAFFLNNLRSVKLQAKSTVSTDDPVFGIASLYFK